MTSYENAKVDSEIKGTSNSSATKMSAPTGRPQVETLLELSAKLKQDSFVNDGERAQVV